MRERQRETDRKHISLRETYNTYKYTTMQKTFVMHRQQQNSFARLKNKDVKSTTIGETQD
jgi:hypothetical protein